MTGSSTDLLERILKLYVQPGARKNEFIGAYGNDGRLKLKIVAPPVDGKANEEVIRFLANVFELRKNQIQLIRGHKSRNKDFKLELKQCVLDEFLKNHLK